MSLIDATAFVTGGSGGLGARIATHLAHAGANVAVGYREGADRAEETCRIVERLGARARAFALDQADPNSITDAVDAVHSHFGSLDMLICNAGMASGPYSVDPGDLDALTPEIWDHLMQVNLRGPFLLARASAPYLRTSPVGTIVHVGSTITHGDWYADRAFAPSKAAVVPLTRFLAASLAPDITVNCVCPGLMVETQMGAGAREALNDSWKARAATGQTTALDDVAGQVVHFCKSPTMTGQSVVIDGGINFH